MMFLICGEALYDVFYGPADARGAMTMQAVVGGSPLNIAVGLARLGRRAGLLAGMSTDHLGAQLAQHVAREGVLTDYLRLKPNPTTLSLIGTQSDGVPAYTFYGRNAADISLTLADMPFGDDAVAGLHVGSYPLVCGPGADALAALAADRAGKLVTLDPNIRPTIEPDMAIWRRRIEPLLMHAGVVKASEEDLGLLYPGEAVASVARRWLDHGPALVIVTRGADGALAYHQGSETVVPARAVAVVDTVGAGDTFQAALIDGLLTCGVADSAGVARLAPAALNAILERAARAAAITCSRRGADLPRSGELPPLG